MVRIAVMAALIVLNFVLQSSVLGAVAFLGATPNTAIIFIVSYGILRGDVEGAIFGLFAGLVQDVFAAPFIGLYALLGLLIGYAAGKPFKDFFRENYFLPLVPVVIAVLAHQLLFYFTSFLFRGNFEFWFYLRTIILPTTVYTAILAVPLYSLLFFINARVERYEAFRRGFFDD